MKYLRNRTESGRDIIQNSCSNNNKNNNNNNNSNNNNNNDDDNNNNNNWVFTIIIGYSKALANRG